jgi:hypothetical protein
MTQDLDLNFENTIDEAIQPIIYENIEVPPEVFFICATHYRYIHNIVRNLEDSDLCMIAIRRLYTHLFNQHDNVLFIELFNQLSYDIDYDHPFRNYKYIDIIIFIIERLRYIVNITIEKIVRKLNKILVLCGRQHLDNVESDHESDLEESD